MQPHPHLRPGRTEHTSGVLARDSVPFDQQQDFAVALAQSDKCGTDSIGTRIVVGMDDETRSLVLEPGVQHAAAPFCSALVGELASGDTQEPGQRIGRQIVEPAPGDREGLGDDILDSLDRASGYVTADSRDVGAENGLESVYARSRVFAPS
jgi:hypothetical protein